MTLNVAAKAFQHAIDCLNHGGIIAYPTEGVYGLGADPFNEKAVMRILELKQRPIEKGLILIGATWEQLAPLLEPLPEERMKQIFASWPGAVTWVFPAKAHIPHWLTGGHKTLAVRVTDHPQAKELCEIYGKPIVSTSANRSQEPPLKDNIEVFKHFHEDVDYILPGRVGPLNKPSTLIDGATGQVLRA